MSIELRRATKSELSKDKRWHLSGVWEVELDHVKLWLQDIANLNVGKANARQDTVLQAGNSLPDEIRARFAAEIDTVDPTLMRAANLGELERSAPSGGLIATFGFLRWVAMSCEVLIFLWLWLIGLGNEVLIVMGFILAAAGFFTGYGAGRLMISHEERLETAELRGWASLFVGILGIVVVAVLRTGGEAEGAFAVVSITTLLALVIALFEALYIFYSSRYKEAHDKMFLCQVWFATAQHQRAYENGLWKGVYETEAGRLLTEHGKTVGQEIPSVPQEGAAK
jgi:hypothetical protein